MGLGGQEEILTVVQGFFFKANELLDMHVQQLTPPLLDLDERFTSQFFFLYCCLSLFRFRVPSW